MGHFLVSFNRMSYTYLPKTYPFKICKSICFKLFFLKIAIHMYMDFSYRTLLVLL